MGKVAARILIFGHFRPNCERSGLCLGNSFSVKRQQLFSEITMAYKLTEQKIIAKLQLGMGVVYTVE